MIETFETYDTKDKTRLIALEFLVGNRGFLKPSHGRTYLGMREYLKGSVLYGLDNPRARVSKRKNIKDELDM